MDPWFALILFLTIAIGFSFLCSILEAVLLSITPSYIAAQTGAFAKRLEELKRDIDKPLAAVLTLNTFAHTIGAAGVGASAQDIWGEESLTIVSAVATLLILIGSEIIPKTIGAVYWERLARPVATATVWLTFILWPLVIMCQLITRMLRQGNQGSVLSRVDLSRVAGLGYRDGLVHKHEHDIITNLMAKEQLPTTSIMTGLDRLVYLDVTATVASVTPQSNAWHVSRIPLAASDIDHMVGYVIKDELLNERLHGHDERPVRELMRPLVIVRGSETLVDLYRKLVEKHEHIAIVTDDAGEKTIGVVTMEDIIEELLGREIVDESDRARGVVD